MANVFKNALAKDVGTTPTTLYTAPATLKSIIIELDVCNTTLGGLTTSVFINSGGQDVFIVKNAPVPVGGSLQVIAGQKIVLVEGDSINVVSSSAASIDVVSSILEDV